jgi:hypothetical protein
LVSIPNDNLLNLNRVQKNKECMHSFFYGQSTTLKDYHP